MKATDSIASLAQRVEAGDMLAAEMLYEKFSEAMYSVSLRITNDKMATEDILQEVFVKSFTRIKSLKEKIRYGGWLKRMIINSSLDFIKKKPTWDELDVNLEMSDSTGEDAIANVSTKAINRAIAALPEKCRAVFSLYLIEGMDHREVAESLQISVSTSKSQYQYALKLLRKTIKKRSNE